MADARVTQVAVETLTLPAPPLRLTQAAVEVLGTSVAVVALGVAVTQAAVEVLALIPADVPGGGGGAGGGRGVGAIANLPGYVNGSRQLAISTTAAATAAARTASLDGDVAYTDAVLIPPPPPGQRVVVTRLAASALVAGAFRVTFQAGPDRVLGPIWLPGSGPLAAASDRVFASARFARALAPGAGLTVTTSADAPQSVEADYVLVDA